MVYILHLDHNLLGSSCFSVWRLCFYVWATASNQIDFLFCSALWWFLHLSAFPPVSPFRSLLESWYASWVFSEPVLALLELLVPLLPVSPFRNPHPSDLVSFLSWVSLHALWKFPWLFPSASARISCFGFQQTFSICAFFAWRPSRVSPSKYHSCVSDPCWIILRLVAITDFSQSYLLSTVTFLETWSPWFAQGWHRHWHHRCWNCQSLN